MPAPSGIVWGDVVDGYGRIGIYTSSTSTNTETTTSVQVWFWSKYGCWDSTNSFYFDNNATTATTKLGSVTIDIDGKSGSGWYDWAQVKIGGPYTYKYSRGTSVKTFNCAAKLNDVDAVNGTMTCTTSYTVPALMNYTISYNANGGSGAPSSQTKWHGSNITISSTKPTRIGYSFQGWGTSSTDTSVDYAAGATYSNNASITLYAIWKANTYTVSYNANGGSGAPSSQTKTYGVNLTLSSTTPTLANYNFKGWGTSASSTTVDYAAGDIYDEDAAITLYAIWELAYTKPRIANFSVSRCNSEGVISDDGTYFKVIFSWETDKTVSSVKVAWGSTSSAISSSGTSGNVEKVLGSGAMDTETAYNIRVTVADSEGSSALSRTLPARCYTIDCRSGGKGVAFFKPSSKDGVDINGDLYTRDVLVTGKCLQVKGTNTIASTDDDTTSNWVAQRNSVHYYTKNGYLTNQPSQYGFLVNLTNDDTVVAQLWKMVSNGAIYHRGGGANGWHSTGWRQILDDINCKNFCLPLSGGTMTGSIKVNDIYNKDGTAKMLANTASYNSSSQIDPDTTLDTLILTNNNTPADSYMYIFTYFYSTRTTTSNRLQIAFPYINTNMPAYRVYFKGAWTDWVRIQKNVVYSTSEASTGNFWTNGHAIYRKTFQVNQTNVNTTEVIGSISGFTHVVKIEGTFLRSDTGSYINIAHYRSSSDKNYLYVDSSGNVQANTQHAGTWNVTIEYTK